MVVRMAVLVGINYAPALAVSRSISPLRFAEADAQAVAALLKEESFDVVSLIGPQATQAAILHAINTQSQAAAEGGLLLFYFSGHGALDGAHTAYMLPYGADPVDLRSTAIPIRELAEGPQATTTMLTLLDCCHSGYPLGLPAPPLVNDAPVAGASRAVAIADGAARFREQVRTAFQISPGRMVLAACAGNELARELSAFGHGVFTYYLLDHWRYAADVDVQSLVRYVDIMLERARLPRPVFWQAPQQGRLVLHDGVATRRLRIPFPRNPFFVGRDEDLAVIDAAIEQGATPALVGMGGAGKSQLAAEFAYRARARFPGGVFWLTMDLPAGIGAQVASYAGHEGLNLPGAAALSFEEKIAAVRAAWEEPLPRLLVFDNLEDPALLDIWRPLTGGSRVLITSRRQVWSATHTVTLHPVRELARPASVTLLLGPRTRASSLPLDAQTIAAAEAICEAVGDLPLALAVAGAYLEAFPHVNLVHYLERLRAADLPDPDLEAELDESLPTHHVMSLVATFQTSYAQFDAARPVDVLALTLLHCAAQCAPEPIPRGLLLRAAGLDPDAAEAEEAAGPALRRLATLGLIELQPDGAVRLHRLLAAYVRSRTPEPAADAARVEEALVTLHEAAEAASDLWSARVYLGQLRHRVGAAGGRADAPAAALYNGLGDVLWALGDYGGAHPLFERALTIREQALGPTHPDTAQSLNNLAVLLLDQGELAVARPLLERALAIKEQALGPTHLDIAHSLNNLADLLHAQGELAAARPLLERALGIKEQALGPTHPDTALSLNNLAALLYTQGELTAARPLFERALAIREQALGSTHPETAQSLTNLAQLLRAQGDLSAARPLLERALAIREQALGPTHPETAQSLHRLARLLQDEGNLDAAHQFQERALAIREQALGPTHPDTAQSLNDLAWVLQAQGDLAGAHLIYDRALEIREQVLGPMHPDTARSLNNLADLLRAQGDLGRARPLYERALGILQERLGPAHPDTRTVHANLVALGAALAP
jgi:tetratricopeptide (TPR) repeat protein